MGDKCNNCGDWTICIIGNYYQCPKCECAFIKPVNHKTRGTIVYNWKTIGPGPLTEGQVVSFWATKNGIGDSDFPGFRVIGEHELLKHKDYDLSVAFKVKALGPVTFEPI